jgi:Domain of unknown function (DUF4352)
VLAGCGGSTKTAVQTVTAPAGTTPTTSTAVATTTSSAAPTGPPDCATVAFQAPKCTSNGILFTVVHGMQTLHLKTLDVNVVGVRTASTVSSGTGISATATGEFLIISIHVANKTSTPETSDGGGFQNQDMLQLSGATYTEDFHAENQADQQSFVTNNSPIQPGESVTGDLVFDVPTSAASGATKNPRAGLVIANFGDDLSQMPSSLGLIALSGA